MQAQRNFFQSIPGVAVITASLLAIPLIAMQFTNQVNWSVGDFVIMGILLFTTGSAFVIITRHTANLANRAAFAAAIGSTFLMIWANAAVGLIGAGPHWGNFMYAGVVATVLIGTYLSRFTAQGMERTMFATSFTLLLVAAIALMANMDEYPGSSVVEILAVNGFFCALYFVAGLLFRYVSFSQSPAKPV
jgi:hypothetical protein